MQQRFTLLLAGAVVFSLAACGATAKRVLDDPPSATGFNGDLSKAYLTAAQREYDEGDYSDADVFAQQARDAAAGKPSMPEELSLRSLPEDTIPALHAARKRLRNVIDAGAREKAPKEAAQAQVSFDCWMQEQEENAQPEDIAQCRDDFELAMAKIVTMITPPPVKEEPPVVTNFLIFFDVNQDELTPETRNTAYDAAANAKRMGGGKVIIGGFTDRSGSARYNLALSLRRAEAVKAAMVAAGVPGEMIELVARGEDDPLVPTDDGIAEPQNRRAEILLVPSETKPVAMPDTPGGTSQS